MRTLQIGRQEAEDLVDLLEANPNPSRLQMADELRLEFGMAYRDGRTDAAMHQFKVLLERLTNAVFEIGEGKLSAADNKYGVARRELFDFVAELTGTKAADTPPHPRPPEPKSIS